MYITPVSIAVDWVNWDWHYLLLCRVSHLGFSPQEPSSSSWIKPWICAMVLMLVEWQASINRVALVSRENKCKARVFLGQTWECVTLPCTHEQTVWDTQVSYDFYVCLWVTGCQTMR